MKEFQELSEDELCPCGSGKTYGECCKKKRFRYGMSDGDIIRRTKITDEAVDALEYLESMFQEYYGREIKQDEYVFAFMPVYNDRFLVENVYAMQEMGLPEEKIYAFYKTDGMLPSSETTDLFSEKDLQEFEKRCEEYREATEGELQNQANILQYVMYANKYLESNLEYTMEALNACMNNFIRRHSKELKICDFEMRSELDYCMFSALKTIKTLESIQKLREVNLSECIYALGRGIFENYMYLCALNGEEDFFAKKLLPRVDEANYRFVVREDGSVNYRRIVHKETGESRSAEVSNKELIRSLPYAEDREIYNVFYSKACQYVHVDVLSAKSYFGVIDPYDEVNPALVAELIIAVIAVMLLDQLRINRVVEEQFEDDARYLCGKLAKILKICLEMVQADTEHPNAVLGVLRKRVDYISD